MPEAGSVFSMREEINQDALDPFYLAAVEAVEEAVVNSLVAGVDVPTIKPPDKVCRAIDRERLAELFAQ